MRKIARLFGLACLFYLAQTPVARADHMSGGTPDILAAYGTAALIFFFGGLLSRLKLLPFFPAESQRKWGSLSIAFGGLLMLVGGWQAAQLTVPHDVEATQAFGRATTQQLLGMTVVGVGAGALILRLAIRRGATSFGETIKFSIFANEDPPDPLASTPASPGSNRLALIPLAAMAVIALLLMGGVLFAIFWG